MPFGSITSVKNLRGKRVLVRVDFNVPVVKGKAEAYEDSRIRAAVPTIEYLKSHGASIVLVTHLGRPGGMAVKELRVDLVARRLGELLGTKVIKFNECVGPLVKKAVSRLRPGQVAMLENVRFEPGEERSDEHFARDLAALGDIYVNDAFSVSHRTAASVVTITKFLPSYAGIAFKEELEILNRILKKPKKPFVVVIGGVKAETKIPVIKSLLPKADYVLLGGGIANTFWAAQGKQIGESLVDAAQFAAARTLVKHKKIILPLDVVVTESTDGRRGQLLRVGDGSVPFAAAHTARFAIMDIGPATVHAWAPLIKRARTIVWNGPVGYFEEPEFSHGTLAVARLVASRAKGEAFGVVGGGETVVALLRTRMAEYVDHISTAGGAMLEYLSGKKLPGIVALRSAHR